MATFHPWRRGGEIYPDRLRLPLAFDPRPLAEEAAAFEAGAWVPHYVPDHYEGEWSALPLRSPAGAVHPIQMIFPNPGARTFEDTPYLARAPRLRAALAAFRCPIQTVRLMRLGPGSAILEHSDDDLFAENGVARIHIPIATGPGVDFRLNGRPIEMAPGSVWYLRLADPHSVVNSGAEDRIHLVLDADVDPWLEAMLAAA